MRRRTRAEIRARDEAREREQADHETLAEAAEGGEDDDPDGDPVDRRERDRDHRASVAAGSVVGGDGGYTRRALGGVVQLVRTPACHAGGRGFESRRSRSSRPAHLHGWRRGPLTFQTSQTVCTAVCIALSAPYH